MTYQVIARKWRPQNFKEVIFQEHVSRTLQNSIKNDRISHAYLFSGPRGVGKTTIARVLAKSLNCLKLDAPTPEPCGECSNCVEIKSGSSFDVIEIDGASNRGIEDIRELRENVNFAPLKSRYKVYIIDEVHMLTKEAFNALLKTLEEPPEHVVFVFATTEIHQIPDTILSRCQKFIFKKIPIEVIVNHLQYITQQEKFEIKEDALYPLARAADGSMRDAQSLLDQVLSFSSGEKNKDNTIVINDVLAILGIVPLESYIQLMNSIINNDAPSLMMEIDRTCGMGVDIPRYVAGLIDMIRAVRLIKHKMDVSELLGFSSDEYTILRDISDKFYDEELGAMFKILNSLLGDLRFSTNERVNLEMAILDLLSVKNTPSIASIIDKLQTGNFNNIQTGGASGPTTPVDSGKKKVIITKNEIAGQNTTATEQSDNEEITHSLLQKKWIHFLQSIKISKKYLHFVLMPAHISLANNKLILQYPADADHSYHYKTLNKDNQVFIQEEMGKRLGLDVGIEVTESKAQFEDPGQGNSLDNISSGIKRSNAGSGLTVIEEAPVPEAELVSNPEVEDFEPANPTVEKIKDIFSGQIIEKEKNNA